MCYVIDELRGYIRDDLLKQCEHNDGVIANEIIPLKAMEVTWYRAPRRSKVPTAVGVLIGMNPQPHVAGETVWVKHIASVEAFGSGTAPSTRTRGRTVKSSATVQERLAFHSFSQGDLVSYKAAEADDPEVQIAIFGVVYKDGTANEQGRKHLVLYETVAEIFFVGNWTQYDPCTPQTVPDNVKGRMLALFEESSEIQGLTGSMLKKRSEEPPPSIKAARAAAKKLRVEKERASARDKRKREAAKAARDAEKAAQRAALENSNATDPPNPNPPSDDDNDDNDTTEPTPKDSSESPNLQPSFTPIVQRTNQVAALSVDELHAQKVAALEAQIALLTSQIKASTVLHASAEPDTSTRASADSNHRSPLPPGWKQSFDESGTPYFYNSQLKRSQYEFPADNDSPPLPPPKKFRDICDIPVPPTFSSSGSSSADTSSTTRISNSVRLQRQIEATRLRGMIPYLEGEAKAHAAGQLAVLDLEMKMHE